MRRLAVTKDENSPTGYRIRAGTDVVNATPAIIRMWTMYEEALGLANRLHLEIEDLINLESAAEGKARSGEKDA